MRKIFNISMVILGILVLGNVRADAQYVLKEADQQYELYNYDRAAILYTKAYENKKTLHSAQRLAESYRLMRDFRRAEQWYATATATGGALPEDFLGYAQMLQANGRYGEAKGQYAKYGSLAKDADAAQLSNWSQSCDSAIKWMKNPKTVTLLNEKSLNSAQSDWAAVNAQGGIVFSSDRTNLSDQVGTGRPFLRFDGNKLPNRDTYGWTGNNYLRLYQKNNGSDSATVFPMKTSSDYHVGAASFSSDGNEVFYTLTRIPKPLKMVGKEPATINVEIYSSRKENGSWGEPVPFRYNSVQQWSVGDPYLTADGNTLYFVSNKPGGQGGTDIYYSTKNTDGSWADAVNLTAVNTPGNERTPSLSNGMFGFSSDGRTGMGGLDIFEGRYANGTVTDIKNLGYPMNSPQDDFAYGRTGKLTGYLSSNRDGGLGSDDIYSFTTKEIVIEKPVFALEGKVLDKETSQPISNAMVSLGKLNGSVEKVGTDASGNFRFALAEKADYTIWAEKAGYMRSASSSNITTNGLQKSTVLNRDLYLGEIVIGRAIRIDNIFYDFDKSNIRPDAALELDKLVATLNENPTIWIELGSHADSRGNDAYNQKLSQNRATAAVNYIISKGIAKERITAKGYGETMLVNGCKNGVKCTDEEHQQNRRTEFKIVKQ